MYIGNGMYVSTGCRKTRYEYLILRFEEQILFFHASGTNS